MAIMPSQVLRKVDFGPCSELLNQLPESEELCPTVEEERLLKFEASLGYLVNDRPV